ncbi:MAG: hypothetical protein ACLRNA_00520 [Gemmiger formicilis]|uniref:hypothetical protein n=1 Tax=Gemmiger formicilis TaxID=745368 RepID=UPI003A47EDE4
MKLIGHRRCEHPAETVETIKKISTEIGKRPGQVNGLKASSSSHPDPDDQWAAFIKMEGVSISPVSTPL